ncbi:MAG TPA: hypothetical protein VFN18_11815 [Solirubrobacterales bacterium]|nr:hypothetical protein [Solirubrobacterales bacterium]
MAAKERNERHDIPPKGALILMHGRVHEVTETWEGTGTGIGEKAGYYTRHDPGDGTAPTKHVHDEGTPWRPAAGQPWDEDRTTPAERALRIRTLAHHADREALQAVLEAGALALVASGHGGHDSRTVERLAAAIAGTFDPYPAEYALERRVHLLNGDEAVVVGRYLNGYGKWEYLVRHEDGSVWKEADGHLFQAWLKWTEPKLRVPKPQSGVVLRALDKVIAQDADPEDELESLNLDALTLRDLRLVRLTVGGMDRRRKMARRLRELEDPTGEVADFAERLEASPWKDEKGS